MQNEISADNTNLDINLSYKEKPDNKLSENANSDNNLSDNVGTGRDLSLPSPSKIKFLSQLMGAYKTTTSKLIRLAGLPEFAWHRSFSDHIVCNQKSFHNIYHYIENNPARWEEDIFSKE